MRLSCSLQVCQGKSGSSCVSSPLSAWEERVRGTGGQSGTATRRQERPRTTLPLSGAGASGFITAQGTTTIPEERSPQACGHQLGGAGDSPDACLPGRGPDRQPLGCQAGTGCVSAQRKALRPHPQLLLPLSPGLCL